MQTTQLTGGRGWLDAPAAASVHRIDRQLGRPADVNDAGRSPEQANANRAAWEAWRDGRGPWAPYALGADESVHCKGLAVDSDDWYNPEAAAVWRANGWRQTARYDDDRDEPWHGEYFAEHDQHINDAPPAPPAAAAAETPMEDDVTVTYCAGTKQKYQMILANAGLFWIVPNGSVETGPVVWLTETVLAALIQDARGSKSKGAAPVLIYDTTAKHWLYAAHGGVVILRGDEERRNIIEQLNPPRLKVPGSYAALIVNNIREGKDG
ncbi:MAG: hypothetical protein LBE05_05675 [Microbacterium sp.]|jgi:hypothetical protein|nr:hypothetical protein [Microbacterium sp.]